MDLETENRIAAILMKEAAEMRRQAEKEGVLAYLRESKARGRPNSRFLTATVLGVQQANRVVEVNEMWRVRQKELELDDRLKGRLKEESSSGQSQRDMRNHRRTTSKRRDGKESDAGSLFSSSKRGIQDCYSQDDESLRDEEMEEFLHSRMELTELLVAGPSVAEVQLGQGWMKLALIFLLPKTPWERRLKALQLGRERDGNIVVFWVQRGHLHLSLLHPRKRSHIIGRRNRRK